MFAWLYRLFRITPREWRLVKTHTVGIVRGDTKKDREEGKFYYHLYESNKGERRVEYGVTWEMSPERIRAMAVRWDDYHEVVVPWLGGRYVPGIPSFNDIDALDVQAKLSN